MHEPIKEQRRSGWAWWGPWAWVLAQALAAIFMLIDVWKALGQHSAYHAAMACFWLIVTYRCHDEGKATS